MHEKRVFGAGKTQRAVVIGIRKWSLVRSVGTPVHIGRWIGSWEAVVAEDALFWWILGHAFLDMAGMWRGIEGGTFTLLALCFSAIQR